MIYSLRLARLCSVIQDAAMLVFIDESGDAGFKLAKGSSNVFAVAMVIFDDHEQAQHLTTALEELKARWPGVREFKFSKTCGDLRDQFFATATGFEFRVRALVVQKELIHSGHLRSNTDAFYQFFVKTMMKFDNGKLQNARVVIDGSGERTFRRDLQTHLKRHTPAGAIKDIRMKDSKGDTLVQLADMCVGAIARSYRDDRKESDRWRKILRPKIDDVWDFK